MLRQLLWVRHGFRFASRVARAFLRNRGLLLAGGVGYNAVLSLLPFFALVLSVLSLLFDRRFLVRALRLELQRLVPVQTNTVASTVEAFVDSRELVGGVGAAALVIFGAIAFRMLEQAIEVIFDTPAARKRRRRPWVSALLPFASMLVLSAAFGLLTLLTYVIDLVGARSVTVFGQVISLAPASGPLLGFLGFASLVVLFVLIYKVLPAVHIPWRWAFCGGLVAALLWEGAAVLITGYFETLSLVDMIYGSLAVFVVVLLAMELGALILLLGAQTLAELYRSNAHGLPWHQEPAADAPSAVATVTRQ